MQRRSRGERAPNSVLRESRGSASYRSYGSHTSYGEPHLHRYSDVQSRRSARALPTSDATGGTHGNSHSAGASSTGDNIRSSRSLARSNRNLARNIRNMDNSTGLNKPDRERQSRN
jgi:hypothetical protein